MVLLIIALVIPEYTLYHQGDYATRANWPSLAAALERLAQNSDW